MSNLKSLVAELALNIKRANVDLEAAPWQTRSSLTNMKREAEEKVQVLKADYLRKIRSNTFGIFLFGPTDRVEQFCRIAEAEAGVMVVNGGYLYQRIAEGIEPTLGKSREFGPTQLQRLINGLNDVKDRLEIRSMKLPELSAITAVNDLPALVGYVRSLVQSAVGDDLTRIYLDHQINEVAVNSQFAGNLLPIVVTGLDRDELASLGALFTNSVSVEVGASEDGEVTKEYVLNQLTGLKKKLKGKNNN